MKFNPKNHGGPDMELGKPFATCGTVILISENKEKRRWEFMTVQPTRDNNYALWYVELNGTLYLWRRYRLIEIALRNFRESLPALEGYRHVVGEK